MIVVVHRILIFGEDCFLLKYTTLVNIAYDKDTFYNIIFSLINEHDFKKLCSSQKHLV